MLQICVIASSKVKMADTPSIEAWNNFIMHSDHTAYDVRSDKRSAAIAAYYMGMANNGGLNHFLTASYELDASEVLESLVAVGALKAAKELEYVLDHLSAPVLRSSQDARWELMDKYWLDSLDDHDVLSPEANRELEQVLDFHVQQHQEFYLALSQHE